jgi:hypothetical protein
LDLMLADKSFQNISYHFPYRQTISSFYGSSGLLSNYTQEMRNVIRAFKDKKDIEDETYYLFFVKEGELGSKDGYMPRKKQFGFIFTSKVTSQNLSKTVSHELAHGAFRLEHTFATYPSLSEGSTDNLMDYSTGTRLHKYQWDLIHNPVSVCGLFEGDDDGAIKSLLTSKYVYMYNQLSTKSYASNVGVNEFTQEAVNYVDSKLYQLDTAGVKTYIYFAYIWFHQGNIDRFDQLIDNTFSHAIDSIKRNLNVKDFNLLAIVNAKYDTALANGLKTVSFREQFYPTTGLSAVCTSSVNDYLKSASKKTFVNGLDAALKERADILLQNLKNCKVVMPEEIVIHYKRKGRNKYRTWGEFTIVGTDYKGYILERPKGENPTQFETDKRVPANTYTLSYSEFSGGDIKFNNVTLYLVDHSGYKLHCGNRVDQSNGCLLINDFSPQYDKYPEAYQDDDLRGDGVEKANVANPYPPKPNAHSQPSNPALKLRNKVREMQDMIEGIYKVSTVKKILVIDESEEKEEL